MAEGASAHENAGDQEGKEHAVVTVNPEDYELEGKGHTSVKIICLGDSAVGKSK